MLDYQTKFHVNLTHNGLRNVFRQFAADHGFCCIGESSGVYSSFFIVDLKNKTIKIPSVGMEIPATQYYIEAAMAKITEYCEAERQTGRTTGLMLQAIGEAILKPGEYVKFEDHTKYLNQHQVNNFATTLRGLISTLGLREIGVISNNKCRFVYIRSTFGIKCPED